MRGAVPAFRVPDDPAAAPRPPASIVAVAADEALEAWAAETAVTLGRAWASPGAPVRLVDLSVWAPCLDQRLGVDPSRGAVDVVLHGAAVEGVVQAIGPGFELVAAGKRSWDPARLFADARMETLLAPPDGGMTLFFLPLVLPGCERALRHAEAVVLLAPRHTDPAWALDEALPRAVAWWGPDGGNGAATETTDPAPGEGRGRRAGRVAAVGTRREEIPAPSGDEARTGPPTGPGPRRPATAGLTPVLVEPREGAAAEKPGAARVRSVGRRGDDGGRWTILLAEDDDDHALLVQMALGLASRKPVELYRAHDGDEAIRILDSLTPDLLLLDLKMPGRSGHEVLEHVKGSDALRRIPVAVLTSSDRDEDVERAYGLGGNHFLNKPDDPRKLQAQLRTLLDNLWELRSIRRGRGVIEASGVTAMAARSPALARAARVGLVLVVLVALLALARWAGLLG